MFLRAQAPDLVSAIMLVDTMVFARCDAARTARARDYRGGGGVLGGIGRDASGVDPLGPLRGARRVKHTVLTARPARDEEPPFGFAEASWLLEEARFLQGRRLHLDRRARLVVSAASQSAAVR